MVPAGFKHSDGISSWNYKVRKQHMVDQCLLTMRHYMADLDDFLSRLEKCHVISLSSLNVVTKNQALNVITGTVFSHGKEVWYFDLDLQYSSTLMTMGGLTGKRLSLLHLFNPGDEETIDSLVALAASSPARAEEGGIVVLDSVNTLQLILREKDYRADSFKANHQASILITLLEMFASRSEKVLILSNLVRARPVAKGEGGSLSWEGELSGGRMIRQKSDAILSVSSENSFSKLQGPSRPARIYIKVDAVSKRCSDFLQEGSVFNFDVLPFSF